MPNPETMTPEQWEHLLTLKTKVSREVYLEFLNSKQLHKEKEKVVKELRAENREKLYVQKTEDINNNKHIVYGLHRNSLFMRIGPQTLKRWANRR